MKRLHLRSAIVTFACSLFAVEGVAQVSSLGGQVVDERGQPLPGVTVAVKSLTDGQTLELTTDTKGHFGRLGLGAGSYVFTFSKDGYRGFELRRYLELGTTSLDPVTLKEAPSGIEGVTTLEFKEFQKEFAKAAELMQAGKLAEAEAIFKEIAAKAPNLAPAHVNLSYIYRQRKDWASAESELVKVIGIAPQMDAYLALADVYLQSRQTDKLRQLLDETTPSFEDNAQFQLEAGFHYFNLQELEKAGAALRKAERLDPSRAETHYYLGALAVGKGDMPGAIARFEKYLSQAAPDDANVARARQMLEALRRAAPTDVPR
jgi:tetratricopeptide (TPR) repeat protein